MNGATNFQRPLKAGNFFSTGMTINCSRRNLLYGVREHTLRMMRMYALRTSSSAMTGRVASASASASTNVVILVVEVVVVMEVVVVVVLVVVLVVLLCWW